MGHVRVPPGAPRPRPYGAGRAARPCPAGRTRARPGSPGARRRPRSRSGRRAQPQQAEPGLGDQRAEHPAQPDAGGRVRQCLVKGKVMRGDLGPGPPADAASRSRRRCSCSIAAGGTCRATIAAAAPSMIPRARYTSRASSCPSATTKTPRFRSERSSPSWISRCIASRTGPRLTCSCRARCASDSWLCGGNVPARTSARSRSAIRAGVLCARSGPSGSPGLGGAGHCSSLLPSVPPPRAGSHRARPDVTPARLLDCPQ